MKSERISRREFLKIAGLGTAASAFLAGATPDWRASRPTPGGEVPRRRVYATACGLCPAGCGLLVATQDGQLIDVQGNPAHPFNHGGLCERGLRKLENLERSDRLGGPVQRIGSIYQPVDWEATIAMLAGVFRRYAPSEIAFLLGPAPDHLFDLVQRLSAALGGASLYRYSAWHAFQASVTLMDACQRLFAAPGIPYFDVLHADVLFDFGADFSEARLALAGFVREGSGTSAGGRPYRVLFSARRPPQALLADEWVPIQPGSEGLLAGALARRVAELSGGTDPRRYGPVDIVAAARAAGVSQAELERLARRFASASRPLAIPGRQALGHTQGVAAASAVLALNALAGGLGREGGLYLLPASPLHPDLRQRPSSMAEVQALAGRMRAGKVKVLLVHGTDPLSELPAALGFDGALQGLELLVSFAPYLDETAQRAHYILPDHDLLESWGYQRVVAGVDRAVVSAIQPVFPPQHATRATMDVLLAAAQSVGGELATALPYRDEIAFLKDIVAQLVRRGGAGAVSPEASWSEWLRGGGWWPGQPTLMPPVAALPPETVVGAPPAGLAGVEDGFPLHLLPYIACASNAAPAGGPDMTLGEAPGPWIEIHPQTARDLGVRIGDTVRVASPFGEMQARVNEIETIRPGVVAVPLSLDAGVGRRDRFGPGANPLDLLGALENASGDLAFMATMVKLAPA
jgi:anaerobic selenocysteine-containing dehydrogenase